MFHNIRDSRRKLFIVFISLSVIILIITVGFAALSATLNINTNTTQTPLQWDVGFVPETVNPIEDGSSSIGRNCPTATATKSSITFGEITVSKPHDSCSYTFKIRNNGSLSADLESVVFSDPVGQSCTGFDSTRICGDIRYRFTRKSNNEEEPLTTENGYICAQEIYYINIKISNEGNTLASSEIVQNNATYTLNFTPRSNDECQPYIMNQNGGSV